MLGFYTYNKNAVQFERKINISKPYPNLNLQDLMVKILLGPEAIFKEKCGVWDPMLELTMTSPYLIVNNKDQLFPQVLKNGVTDNSKKENKGTGREGVRADCMLKDILWSIGKPHAGVDFNPLHSGFNFR
jgi:hypothetical protein